MTAAPDASLHSARTATQRHLPRVVTIVLNWRRPDETLSCVQSLLKADYPNQHLLVVDNSAGTTGIDARLGGLPVEIVRNPANLGFTGGVNVGIRHAVLGGADYIWLMNSDATAEPDCLRRLVQAAEEDDAIGLVSPVIRSPSPDHPIVFCLGRQSSALVAGDSTRDPAEACRWLRERPGEAVLYGTALLIRRTLVDAIGGLDDRFFAYGEDIDYSLRCHDAGFRVAVCFDATCYHQFKDILADPLPPYVHYLMNRNQLMLWRKRNGHALLRRPLFWYFYQRLLKVERERRDAVAVNALLAGLWDGLAGVTGAFNPSCRAPWLLLHTVGRHPGLVLNILEGKLPWRARPG